MLKFPALILARPDSTNPVTIHLPSSLPMWSVNGASRIRLCPTRSARLHISNRVASSTPFTLRVLPEGHAAHSVQTISADTRPAKASRITSSRIVSGSPIPLRVEARALTLGFPVFEAPVLLAGTRAPHFPKRLMDAALEALKFSRAFCVSCGVPESHAARSGRL